MSITKTEQIAIERAIALLNAAKAKYKIILPDGTEYGELVVAKARTKRNFKHPHGMMSAYFQPLIKDMQPGEVLVVDASIYGPVDLRATMSGWCAARWGKGNVITSINHENNTVEVMRVA